MTETVATDEDLTDRVVAGLRAALDGQLHAIVLYGSRARGDHHADSDWDVLVIADGLPAAWWDRYQFMKGALPPGTRGSVAILPETPAEFDAHLPEIYLDIALDGKILYDRAGFASQRIKELQRIIHRAGLYRESTPAGLMWRWLEPPRKPWSIEWEH